jgi:hypothetical protein
MQWSGCCANENRMRRVYIRSKVARGKTYYQIVEGVRSGPEVRQWIVIALGQTPDPAVALGNMKHDLSLLRTQRKHQRGVASRSITLARKLERLDVRIRELESKIETLSKILRSRLISTTPKQQD